MASAFIGAGSKSAAGRRLGDFATEPTIDEALVRDSAICRYAGGDEQDEVVW